MNPIGLVMDLLLAGMLALALILGLQLNRRLKALKDGQAGFAEAVADLDAAAARAAAGLADLRRVSEETDEALFGRIETARELVGRLETAMVDAKSAVAGLAPSVTSLRAAPPPPLRRGGEDRVPAPLLAGELSAKPTEGARLASPQPRRSPPARRPAADEELFDLGDRMPSGSLAHEVRRTLGERR